MKKNESLIAVCALAWLGGAQADPSLRQYQLSLVAADGARTVVAQLFVDDQQQYQLQWDASQFSDHFLSMRPFKCLAAVDQTLWCRVPYPYAKQSNLAIDLVDLEYDLLFVWKRRGEYGINLRNGLYFQLQASGAGWDGVLHQVDLEALGVPPEPGVMRPIGGSDLDEAEGFAWPRLALRPRAATAQ
nr:hypothetical protein [Oceanococcus sp. HetDA_MAG_MS8]